ncbi:MAG: hypothetical protein PVG75_04725 [Thioalkalispiraceae bacterium]|jgi:hypothetical protein
MKFDKPLAENENIVAIDRTSFGYTVTHKKGKKIIFTGSYEHESEAVRTATKLAKYLEAKGETVWYCLNYAFDKGR